MALADSSELTLETSIKSHLKCYTFIAYELAKDNKRMFEHVLTDENKTAFCDVYQQACRIADENLIARTSRYLRSIQTDLNSEEYFYNIFRPFVESMISELSRRFNSHFQKVATISNLLPINVVNSNIKCPSDARARFDTVTQLYEIDLQHSADVVSQEIFMWALKWK